MNLDLLCTYEDKGVIKLYFAYVIFYVNYIVLPVK